MTLTIAALASGTGTNVAAIQQAIASGSLDARIALVLSNNPDAPVLEIARKAGIAVWAKDHRLFADREAFDVELKDAIISSGADTVVLAGYMRMLSAHLVQAFAGRILNIHPALLPSFPGIHGIRDAIGRGVRLTGVTVHFVDEKMDHGPIIIQAALPVRADDTEDSLAPRIHALEYRLYSQALQWLAENRLRIEGRAVRLLPGSGATQALAGPDAIISPALENRFNGCPC